VTFNGTGLARVDPRRNRTKNGMLVAQQAMVITAIRRKEISITCLRYPVSSGIMIWGYGTVKLATPIT
jgi:hypothetical protein